MASLYEQLASMTVVVADTGDIESIERFRPRDATTNPSLIAQAAGMDAYADLVDGALVDAGKETGGDAGRTVERAIELLAIAFGTRILGIIDGRVSTEVDARLSYDTDATVAKAREIVDLYGRAGIDRERVLIKIASTWEGIRAAEALEREGIHCNLTLLFGMHQAVACAEAGVTLISPFVGRILDWYKKDTGRESYPPHEDPGVQSVTRIYHYFKKFGHETEIMGASFRTLAEIRELAGCDLLTIAPKFLAELRETDAALPRKLHPDAHREHAIERIAVDRPAFDAMHAEDRMASEKLAEGIEGFANAARDLEKMLRERLAALDDRRAIVG